VLLGAIGAGALTCVAVFQPQAFSGRGLFSNKRDVEVDQTTDRAKARLDLETARASARSNGRDSGLKLATGVGAIAAALLAWGRLELSKDEQDSERYSKAIDHLSSDQPDAQLGGLYALERLATTSARDQQGTIVEVLSAFVRRSGPNKLVDEQDTAPHEPAIQVQAALTILGRHDWSHRVDLSSADLGRANLEDSNFTDAFLTRANLAQASLNQANLTRANLIGANLAGAYLRSANLNSAVLSCADLSGADVDRADFTNAKLTIANLTKATLRKATLTGADLSDANLKGANLTKAQLDGAQLNGADLTGANLTDANLTGAMLYDVNLTGANLTGAEFKGAELNGADLTGADLTEANLTAQQSISTKGISSATQP
jgi:uncharacterized protein YjbI with pentapeptide repeats